MVGAEKVVIVCHGMPEDVNRETDELEIYPQLLALNLQAVLLAQRGSSADAKQQRQLTAFLSNKCKRVFGLTVGWDSDALNKENLRAGILDFLKCDEDVPSNAEVQKVLGFALPITRLALRIALEITVREFEKDKPENSNANEARLRIQNLLAPALTIARRESSLNQLAVRIEASFGDRARLHEEMMSALSWLRQN
jgi:hypothetical protein